MTMRNFVFMMSIAAAILIGMTQGPREGGETALGNELGCDYDGYQPPKSCSNINQGCGGDGYRDELLMSQYPGEGTHRKVMIEVGGPPPEPHMIKVGDCTSDGPVDCTLPDVAELTTDGCSAGE